MSSDWRDWDGVTELQQWAWTHGYLFKLNRQSAAQIQELWERLDGNREAFFEQIEAGALA